MGKYKSWQDLLRDFLKTPAARRFSDSDKGGLEQYLAAPAAIARWIEEFAPELKKRNSLHIVISGAAQDAVSYDMGRWYQFLPSLLGAPGMKVTVALVGRELTASRPSAVEAEMKASAASVPAASIHDCTLAEYMDAFRWQPDPELVFLFHPELGGMTIHGWFRTIFVLFSKSAFLSGHAHIPKTRS